MKMPTPPPVSYTHLHTIGRSYDGHHRIVDKTLRTTLSRRSKQALTDNDLVRIGRRIHKNLTALSLLLYKHFLD